MASGKSVSRSEVLVRDNRLSREEALRRSIRATRLVREPSKWVAWICALATG